MCALRTRASLCTNSLSIPRRSSAAAPVPEHLQVELLRVFLWRKVPRVERRVARAAARERGQVARRGSLEPKVAAHAHLRGMRGWAPRRCVRDGSRRTCTRVSQNANKQNSNKTLSQICTYLQDWKSVQRTKKTALFIRISSCF